MNRLIFREYDIRGVADRDLTDEVVENIGRAFGSWERRPVRETTVEPVPRSHARAIYLIDKPGAAQSSVRIGGIGVARATPDFFPLLVMNTVLGVPFGSRLNQNLRESKAYTYGARSSFDMRGQPGPFTARAEIVADKTDSAVVEFMAELSRIRDTVPADELARAKRYLQTRLPGEFETPSDIANRLVPIALYDLPLDFYNSYSQRVESVTQAEVHPEVVLPEGLVMKRGSMAASKVFRVKGGVEYDHSGQYAAFGAFAYS